VRQAEGFRSAVIAATAVALLTATWLGAEDQHKNTVIRVPVRLVTVPSLVITKDGKTVNGLDRNDFHLFDNGRLQSIRVDDEMRPASIVLAIQVSSGVREYLPFITKTGSLAENSLQGANSEAALLTYNDNVTLKKPFDQGDIRAAMRQLSASGDKSRLIDAGLTGIDLLSKRSPSRARILLFIGQPFDSGSNGALETLKTRAEDENVSIFALALPVFGKSFVADTFSLEPVSSITGKGGFKASVELTKLIPAMRHSEQSKEGGDPFSALTDATGGALLNFRKQKQLEDALPAIGEDFRSLYLLSYIPDTSEVGHHDIKVQVDIQGAKVRARSGYERQ
jgi:VWFA-related protein